MNQSPLQKALEKLKIVSFTNSAACNKPLVPLPIVEQILQEMEIDMIKERVIEKLKNENY